MVLTTVLPLIVDRPPVERADDSSRRRGAREQRVPRRLGESEVVCLEPLVHEVEPGPVGWLEAHRAADRLGVTERALVVDRVDLLLDRANEAAAIPVDHTGD